MPASARRSSCSATACSSPITAETTAGSKVGPTVAAVWTTRRSTPGALSRQVSSSCSLSGIGSVRCSRLDRVSSSMNSGIPSACSMIAARASSSRRLPEARLSTSRSVAVPSSRPSASRADGVPPRDRCVVASGGHREDTRGASLDETAQQLEGGGVGPVQVLDGDEERCPCVDRGQPVHENGEGRVEQALGSSSGVGYSAVAGIPPAGRGRDRPRRVQAQGTEVADEWREPVRAVARPAQLALEQPCDRPQRDVGVVRQARRAEHPAPAGLHPVEDLREQAGLADARLADHEERGAGRAEPSTGAPRAQAPAACRVGRPGRPARPCGTAPSGSGRRRTAAAPRRRPRRDG